MHVRPRPPLSISAACARARDILGVVDMAEATARSISAVHAWCDPDRPQNVPSVRHAVAVDQLCMARAGERPITETMRLMTDRAPATGEITDALLKLMREVGEVAGEAEAALADGRLSPRERDRLAAEIADARRALDLLDRLIAEGGREGDRI